MMKIPIASTSNNVNELTYDVIIAGGGPAGLSTALALCRYSKLSVAVVEATAFDNFRTGEYVSNALLPLLKYLGIRDDNFNERHLTVYRSYAAWGSSNLVSRESLLSQYGSNYQLDRSHFDFCLVRSLADAGAIVLPRTRCKECCPIPNDGWKVMLTHPEWGRFTLNCRYFVDATGRQSFTTRKQYAELNRLDHLVGVGVLLRFGLDKPLSQDFLVETVPEGWWYSAAIPNHRMVVVLFTDADIASQLRAISTDIWPSLLIKTQYTRHRAFKGVAEGKPWVKSAFSHITVGNKLRNWSMVGDAAVGFDPISSMGIGFAVSSGCNLGRSIQHYLETSDDCLLKAYQDDLDRLFKDYLLKRDSYYGLEKRWSDQPFWQRRSA